MNYNCKWSLFLPTSSKLEISRFVTRFILIEIQQALCLIIAQFFRSGWWIRCSLFISGRCCKVRWIKILNRKRKKNRKCLHWMNVEEWRCDALCYVSDIDEELRLWWGRKVIQSIHPTSIILAKRFLILYYLYLSIFCDVYSNVMWQWQWQ